MYMCLVDLELDFFHEKDKEELRHIAKFSLCIILPRLIWNSLAQEQTQKRGVIRKLCRRELKELTLL